MEMQNLPDFCLDHITVRTKPLSVTRLLLCSKRNEMLATLSVLAHA